MPKWEGTTTGGGRGRCGKVRYPTERQAAAALARVVADPLCFRPETLRVYWCPACNSAHLGNAVPIRDRDGRSAAG